MKHQMESNFCILLFNKINGYIEDNNGKKYLTLVPVNQNKRVIKMYKEI